MASALTTRRSRWSATIVALSALVAVLSASPEQTKQKFFSDDPLWRSPDTQDASMTQPWVIDLTVDFVVSLFGNPGDKTANVRAQNVNTVDEVPDSSWYTNRAGRRPLTVADVAKGPDASTGPAPGTWTVTSAKSDGVTPGFTIRDSTGTRWFLKFDPPGMRGMSSGTEVTVTKLMWALGYHVPENYIAVLRPEQLVISPDTRITPPGGVARPMKRDDITSLLKRADREPDGSYRIVASRGLPGRPLGGFRFYGTRPDDPNDIVPHEHRRELRGYGTFASWLNHVDAKSINTLDMLITEGTRAYVRHNLLDFGSALGSGGVAPREAWEGQEYFVQVHDIAHDMFLLGFPVRPWRTIDLYESPAIGAFPKDNKTWNPDAWRSRVPNPAFVRARADDKFWAATKLAALSDDLLRAAVAAGQFGDPEAEAFLTQALIERRDAILRTYLPAINPIASPALGADGTLTFANAAVDARVAQPPQSYRAVWFTVDNSTGATKQLAETTATTARLSAPPGLPTAAGAFVKIEVSASDPARPSWATPVSVYFKRTAQGWTLVGLERQQ